ncbi:4-galactosyl-N-acetylglucosaminide 3-alpha-L-fucosyltransferase 9-like [Alosa alosa]|uniref:4-galactosyl-N-acetylglucosaminide 3-alpha-L-fucosyltransferase 9-like n=1 Tax=Alosa alosa TaxID=278164 RepID=UPI0020151A63|nr:4-galactosyl-N-acetylglucosaminide 3-alpha-L-fucosyltransferase 9-like [Alosa alosa]
MPSSEKMFQEPKQAIIFKSTKTTILLWYWPFGVKDNLEGDVCRERFGIQNCMLVDNQSQFSKADFVVFHHLEVGQWTTKVALEPYTLLCTMSYRCDADIYVPYGSLIKEKDLGTEVKDLIPKGKTHFACWVVSNFLPNHKRTAVYKKLSNIIPIVVYGKAVGNRLDDQSLLPTISRCYFYLAFENSIYRDYITEKFWYNAFMGGAVPVVLGPPREQYEAVAPKDFNSVEQLGEFLKKLIEDRERYVSYFNWKLKYTVLTNYWIRSLCGGDLR